MDAIVHARKHLAGDQSSKFGLQAGGLMAYPPDTFVEPYQVIRDARFCVQFQKLTFFPSDTVFTGTLSSPGGPIHTNSP